MTYKSNRFGLIFIKYFDPALKPPEHDLGINIRKNLNYT